MEDVSTKNIAQELTTARMLNITELREGLSIASTSYVGRINLGKVQITIRPKVSGTPLVHLLQCAYGLCDLHTETVARYESEERAFQDILIYQLIEEVSELVARGLHRRYIRTDDVLSSPQGRINLQGIVKQGGVIQATIPCTYSPRLENCLANQVLLQGLYMAAGLTSDRFLHIRLYRLANLLQESVSSIRLNIDTLQRLLREMDRLISAYHPAISIIEMLFRGEGISLDGYLKRIQLPGFLFNMDLFFQALLSRFLNEHLEEYEVRDQYKIKGMMSYDPFHNPRKRRAPTPRPDYVIMQHGQVVSILDAKYRDLWERDLPVSMLYQLAIYALSQPQGVEAVILYPTMQNKAQEARIVLSDPVYGTGRAHVVLRPVKLLYFEHLVTNARTVRNEREQVALARQLVFGG